MGASDTAYVRQNISVSVDLPRHNSQSNYPNGITFILEKAEALDPIFVQIDKLA